ncbi:MAG TPA: ABC transporter ATP-binding protein [bacterium]|nr:ABC transporter ATP-binding protein [bacterium]
MADHAAIEARGVTFGYGAGPTVLNGVDLQAEAGEVAGVIGPNGSGKTTLVNVLSCTVRPAGGEVRMFGRDAQSLTARERAKLAAVVPQEARVAFPFTALEIALMGRAPYLGRWRLEAAGDLEAAGEALRQTGMYELRERKFHELSGGEKQRVMVAKALAQRPRILLLDEPTAFLDLKHQVEIYELARGLARERGICVLAVSHDINLAAMYCDRLHVLDGGRIVASGAPAEVLDPALLERVYGVAVGVARHPGRGEAPLIFPMAGRSWRGESS